MASNKHLIVISEDAMVCEDLETLRHLPVFGSVWDQAAMAESIRTIYPSLTYPVHTSIRTGAWPDKHGIVNNELTNLKELSSPWEWFNDSLKCTDIFDAAKKAGLTTAAVFWPVTGNHPSIDWLVDEYWPQNAEQSTDDCFAESGSTPEVIEKIVRPNEKLLNGKHRQHPYADAFVHACACDMIRAFKPNLLMIHPANVDAYRHHTGVFSELVTHGLHEIDGWLGDIIKACRDAGIMETTNIAIISDHGQLNIVRAVAMNAVLAANGLIDVAPDGSVADYTAMIKSTGLSAQVYLKDPADKAAWQKTYDVLNRLAEEGVWGISRVYTAEEAEKEEHLAGGFQFVIETDGWTSFSNDWKKPFVRPIDITDYRFGHGTHGHHPDKGAQPMFFAFGPDFKAGARVGRRDIIDEAPTFAKIFGFEMPDADGVPMTELLHLTEE